MKSLKTAMITSISEVMEIMFFLPVEFKKESENISEQMAPYKPIMACSLKFSGDASGEVILVISKSLLKEMAENFMGTPEEELENEHISGTLTEFLNMVFGNALGKVDSSKSFEFGIPEEIDESKISDTLLFSIIVTPESLMAINIDSV